ncbi:MAG TPA: NAD(P)H-hydrate dehydratase [Candidatus Choladousia intestinipullorum]|nr:NAD(P)H-hydrate dehydratase [Candidatus Choladousia intestinipullorum]
MEFLLNAAQMKQYDYDTIHRIGIPSLVLMERAALCVAEEMHRFGCDLSSVLVVCGSGNNGGDGFAVARILDEQGVRVRVAFVGREESMSEETLVQRKICENCGIKISSNYTQYEYTTIVDAVFGIGLSRDVEGRFADAISWINGQDACRVSVDMPSGIETDTGRIMKHAVMADLTVTFACRKLGHVLYPGAEFCGRVVCRDIGITAGRLQGGLPSVFTYSKEDLAGIAGRKAYSNKGTYGKVLLIAGCEGMSGAACLSALASYRSGCGLVRVFTQACNRQVIQTYLPEAIVSVWEDEKFPQELLDEALEWSDVAGIGPGFGTGNTQKKILTYVLGHYEKPLVIDADGLNLLAKERALLCSLRPNTVLTPHIGEMMRLIEGTKEEVLQNIVHTAAGFAEEYHAVCVLKDARTVVSNGRKSYINTSGNSGMAAGGSGDILTGIICGLLAQHMPVFEAASLGVYLHGLAGDAAKEKRGAYGMIARDIADEIGNVLKRTE